MAKFAKKSSSSPLVLIIPLVIALIVVFSAVILTRTKTNTESKASYNPTQKCLAACDNKKQVKDVAACKLDCPAVIAGTMTCKTFCGENVKPDMIKTVYGTISTIGECNQQCSRWIADPCRTDGGVCGGSVKTGNAQACQTACNEVKDEEKTCTEAFVPDAFGANTKLLDLYKTRCVGVFE